MPSIHTHGTRRQSHREQLIARRKPAKTQRQATDTHNCVHLSATVIGRNNKEQHNTRIIPEVSDIHSLNNIGNAQRPYRFILVSKGISNTGVETVMQGSDAGLFSLFRHTCQAYYPSILPNALTLLR